MTGHLVAVAVASRPLNTRNPAKKRARAWCPVHSQKDYTRKIKMEPLKSAISCNIQVEITLQTLYTF